MTNIYIVQKWLNNGWHNFKCYSSEKKAKFFVSEMAFQGKANDFRIFNMPVL